MADQFSAAASALSAKDYSGEEHKATELRVTEGVSAPFEIQVTIVAKSFDVKEQLGQGLTITRYTNESGTLTASRVFHGMIIRAQQLGLDSSLQYASYQLTLRPWLWLLKHTQAFRVYQNQSTQDIVTDIFTQAGFSGWYSTNSLPSTKREYCLQYNESDFDFVTRLLAEEGINYFFTHSDDSHKLVLQDAQTPFDQASTSKFDMSETPSGDNPLITHWQPECSFHGTSIELEAYDYTQSKLVSSKAKTSSHSIASNSKLSTVHYPPLGIVGDYTDLADNLVKRRLEQLEQNYERVLLSASQDEFTIGSWFSLASHLDTAQLGDYAVVETRFYYSESVECEARVTVIPKAVPYYPTPQPKPVIQGLQSALVAGSTAGDINQDDQGRVRIQFHWDTDASGDKTSCYVRVAQMMAGSSYGSQFVPRAGHEVLVSFIDGDPDQPIITGCVYNSKNTPPYNEENTTKSGWKTQLSGESNELYFDDKQDNELIYLHAAKDLTREVENDLTETVQGEVKQTVTKAMTITTEDNYSLTSSKTLSENAKTITIEADDKLELIVGSSKITMSSSSVTIESESIDIKASSDLSLEGTNVSSSATSSNTISGATTSLEASGSNSISGLSISMDADTSLTAQGQLSAEFKSDLKATFDGGVMGEVKGAIVKVN